MGRASVKENKNRYHLAREELGLTREEAADLLKVIPADRIERILYAELGLYRSRRCPQQLCD